MPFEFDVRVPFFVRGPNVPRGIVIQDIVLNIDIAPSLLQMAGTLFPHEVDGASFLPLLSHARAVVQARKGSKEPGITVGDDSRTGEGSYDGRSKRESSGHKVERLTTSSMRERSRTEQVSTSVREKIIQEGEEKEIQFE